jgi:hypothetical protein|tara:strand:- start:713 stop:829 length:117 start_codon:yes stop_codon:yes gene_type:complete
MAQLKAVTLGVVNLALKRLITRSQEIVSSLKSVSVFTV